MSFQVLLVMVMHLLFAIHGNIFRPAYYYHNDEIAVVASERPVIQTAFNLKTSDIKELKPGHVFLVKKDGQIIDEQVSEPQTRSSCSFEHIYFSRGSDSDIYKERKKLGELLIPAILSSIDYDLKHTVFSYIPNTAESAFYGMVHGANAYLNEKKKKKILESNGHLSPEQLDDIMNENFRIEKVAIKDAKLRTFISQDKGRANMVGHVYDITYDSLEKNVDNLVVIDDSIVRGTTLKQSIIKILSRLEPKKIIILSSSPQIRYPDCYGIDMAKLGDFIAFQAAIALLKETSRGDVITKVYNLCKERMSQPGKHLDNFVKAIYAPFSPDEISDKISLMLRSPETKAELKIIYQTVENLHIAIPNDSGDWYFTGNYPTPGGNKVANNAFINYVENKNKRAY